MNKLDRLFAAITFAEAGDFVTAREFSETDRSVLLAVQDDVVDARVMNCALNLCTRVDAGLDVLVVSPQAAATDGRADPLAGLDTRGIPHRLTHRSGTLGREILRYVHERRQIAFVVIDSLASWGGPRGASPWEQLACPLVVAQEIGGKT